MPSRDESKCMFGEDNCRGYVADKRSRLAVIVTHPYGPLGGNMNNNVVMATVLYFQKLGITTLRFNFEGSQVGRGYQQVKQIEEAAKFLLNFHQNEDHDALISPSYLLLVGYSYGSLITMSASASIDKCIGVICLAPPFAVAHWLLLFHTGTHRSLATQKSKLPRLFCIGDTDNFTSEGSFQIYLDQHFGNSQCTVGAVVKGCDHFFVRRESELMAIIGEWLLKTYHPHNNDLSELGQMNLVQFVLAQKETDSVTPTKSKSSSIRGLRVNGESLVSSSFNCGAFLMPGSG